MTPSTSKTDLQKWYVEKSHPSLAAHYNRVDCRLQDPESDKDQKHGEFRQELLDGFKRDRLQFWLELLREDDVHSTGVKNRIRTILTDVDNENHFKGLVGELLLDWHGASFRPQSFRSAVKVSTSTEPGADMVELYKDEAGTAYVVIWEAKSTSGFPSDFSERLKEFFSNRAREVTADVLEKWIAEGTATAEYPADVLRNLITHLYKNSPSKVFFGSFIACDGQHITNRPNALFPPEIPVSQRKLTIFEVRDFDKTVKEWGEELCRVRDSL